MSKELLAELGRRGLLEYGSHIPGDLVREILCIEYPEYGTKQDFDEVALTELSAIDYVRNALLNDGKYLGTDRGDYRVLLPSENKRQIDAYVAQADRKLRRAIRLSRNTPAFADAINDHQNNARIVMKRESLRSRHQFQPCAAPPANDR